PKSNSAYMAINQAEALVKESGDLSVPLHLRNAPTKLMKQLGYGKDYKYSHSYANNFVDQEFLPEELSGTTLYSPQDNRKEKEIDTLMDKLWGMKYKNE
ncbi:MAG TPA: AAA family ATPase, partial [Bacteroidales bacterium]|nr:AAA family ATPase [Bacteroidales bacterium]